MSLWCLIILQLLYYTVAIGTIICLDNINITWHHREHSMQQLVS